MPIGPATFNDPRPVQYRRRLEYLIQIIDDSIWKNWEKDGLLQSRYEIEIWGYHGAFPEDSIRTEIIGIYQIGWKKVEFIHKEKHFVVLLER